MFNAISGNKLHENRAWGNLFLVTRDLPHKVTWNFKGQLTRSTPGVSHVNRPYGNQDTSLKQLWATIDKHPNKKPYPTQAFHLRPAPSAELSILQHSFQIRDHTLQLTIVFDP